MSQGAQEEGEEAVQHLVPALLWLASGEWAWKAQVCSHAALFVSPQIPFSDGGPGQGGHQLPWLGLNDFPR